MLQWLRGGRSHEVYKGPLPKRSHCFVVYHPEHKRSMASCAGHLPDRKDDILFLQTKPSISPQPNSRVYLQTFADIIERHEVNIL